MHVNESLKSIRWDDFEPSPVRGENKSAVIADAHEFRIRRVPLEAGGKLTISAGEQARILSVVSGQVRATMAGGKAAQIVGGENVILPYAGAFEFEAAGGALLLLTENFS
jgi:mannose-6-phosphate isomerase